MNALSIETCNMLFRDCPTATALFDSISLRLIHANPAMLRLWGKDQSIVGQSIHEFMPELESQGYPDMLHIVGTSDSPFSEKGAKVEININGELTPIYMDYNYTPVKLSGKKTVAIFVTANEVCEKQLNLLSGEEYERNLRAMVLAAPTPMCVFRGWKLTLEVVNSYMYDLWKREERMNLRMIKDVFHTGHPLKFVKDDVTYSCTPLRNEQGSSVGCVLIAVQDRIHLKAHLSNKN
jgi:hypothetical protein